MFKSLLLAIYFLLFTAFANAQHTYQLLQKRANLNSINQAIDKEPNNLLLRAERIHLFSSNNSTNDNHTLFTNFDKNILLKDLDLLMSEDKPLEYYNITLTKEYLFNKKINILQQFNNSDEMLEQAYQEMITILKHKSKSALEPMDMTIAQSIVDFFLQKTIQAQNNTQKTAYADKAMNALSILFPLQELLDFDMNKPINTQYLVTNVYRIYGVLVEHPNKDLAIQYYKSIIKCNYVYILENKFYQFEVIQSYSNILMYANMIMNIYAERKDYANAYIWANAFFKDQERIFEIIKPNNIDFHYLNEYTFNTYEFLYHYYLQQPNKEFNKIFDAIFNMVKNIAILDEQQQYKKVENILAIHEKDGENHPIYNFAKATFKFNNRMKHVNTYKIYRQELLNLLDKTQALVGQNPHINFMYGVIYIELFNNEDMARTYFQKVLEIKNHPLHKTIERNYLLDIQLDENYNPYPVDHNADLDMNLAIIELTKK